MQEPELFKHDFAPESWGDFHVVTVFSSRTIYEIINYGNNDPSNSKWEREDYTHHQFYERYRHDMDLKPVINFLVDRNLIHESNSYQEDKADQAREDDSTDEMFGRPFDSTFWM